jgi:hypothetical protein
MFHPPAEMKDMIHKGSEHRTLASQTKYRKITLPLLRVLPLKVDARKDTDRSHTNKESKEQWRVARTHLAGPQ